MMHRLFVDRRWLKSQLGSVCLAGLPGLLVSLSLVSCKTTAPYSEANSAEAPAFGRRASGAAAGVDSFDAVMNLERAEAQSLYIKMLEAELKSPGNKVANKQAVPVVKATLICRRDIVPETCNYQVLLINEELSAAQPMNKELVEKLWGFARAARADLMTESSKQAILMDLSCTYKGQSIAPYDLEQVSCTAAHPRAVNEAVIVGAAAEEIGDLIRGEAPLGDKQVTLTGTMVCQWESSSQRSSCTLGAAGSDTMRAYSAQNAQIVGRLLQQAWANGERQKNPKAVIERRDGMGGMLSCVVDNTRYSTDGTRRAVCLMPM